MRHATRTSGFSIVPFYLAVRASARAAAVHQKPRIISNMSKVTLLLSNPIDSYYCSSPKRWPLRHHNSERSTARSANSLSLPTGPFHLERNVRKIPQAKDRGNLVGSLCTEVPNAAAVAAAAAKGGRNERQDESQQHGTTIYKLGRPATVRALPETRTN